MKDESSTERLQAVAGESVRLPRSMLVIVEGPDAGRRILHGGGTRTLGSGDAAEVKLAGRGISRLHPGSRPRTAR